MSAEKPSGLDQEREHDQDESRVRQLITKALERYGRLLRRPARE